MIEWQGLKLSLYILALCTYIKAGNMRCFNVNNTVMNTTRQLYEAKIQTILVQCLKIQRLCA